MTIDIPKEICGAILLAIFGIFVVLLGLANLFCLREGPLGRLMGKANSRRRFEMKHETFYNIMPVLQWEYSQIKSDSLSNGIFLTFVGSGALLAGLGLALQ